MNFGRKKIVHLIIEQVAALLAHRDELPDLIVFFFKRQSHHVSPRRARALRRAQNSAPAFRRTFRSGEKRHSRRVALTEESGLADVTLINEIANVTLTARDSTIALPPRPTNMGCTTDSSRFSAKL